LALRESLTRTGAILCFAKIKGMEPLNPKEAIRIFDENVKGKKLIDDVIVEKIGTQPPTMQFWLNTGDRQIFLCEDRNMFTRLGRKT
jgi:hypothetical protein